MKKNIILLLSLPLLLNATPLSDVIADGHIDGEVKLFYYHIDKKDAPNAFASSLGGQLKYTTDTKQPFFASLGFHTSNPVFSNKNKEKTYLFNNDKDASALTAISESFIAYKTQERVIRLGNVLLNTPMMNNDTTRIVPWSYQGFFYTGTTLKDTKVQLNHISAIRSHTSDSYTKESASGDIGSKGVTMLSFHYAHPKRYNLQAYYYYAPDLYSTFIAQADYSFDLHTNVLYCFGLQYFKSGNGGRYNQRENKNGGDDIDLIALRVAAESDTIGVALNYSQNFGISGMVKGYGGLTKTYTTSMIANGRGNYKPETWMLKLSYELPLKAKESELALWLTDTKVHDNRGDSFQAYYMHYRHRFTKELSLYVRYEHLNYEKVSTSDSSYFRVISSYEF